MVNKGVSEFKIPASALSIFVSAIQNKKAGIKLPIIPESSTKPIFSLGIFLSALVAKGNKTSPAKSMRSAAT